MFSPKEEKNKNTHTHKEKKLTNENKVTWKHKADGGKIYFAIHPYSLLPLCTAKIQQTSVMPIKHFTKALYASREHELNF